MIDLDCIVIIIQLSFLFLNDVPAMYGHLSWVCAVQNVPIMKQTESDWKFLWPASRLTRGKHQQPEQVCRGVGCQTKTAPPDHHTTPSTLCSHSTLFLCHSFPLPSMGWTERSKMKTCWHPPFMLKKAKKSSDKIELHKVTVTIWKLHYF